MDDDFDDLNNDELSERIRVAESVLMKLPEGHPNRDEAIREWRRATDERNRRIRVADPPPSANEPVARRG